MPPEFANCPICKQKLAIQDYVIVGADVVCNNCESNLRIEKRRPLRIALVPVEETFNIDSRPELYG